MSITPLPGIEGAEPDKSQRIINETRATGEPVFVLRAKDLLSLMAIEMYAELVERYAPSSDMAQQLADIGAEFRAWQHANPAKVKFPD